MIKAVFFDIDGTLVSHTSNSVPESARRALGRLAEKGILRIAATGRSMMELEILPVKDIAFDGYITLNGQLCLDAQGNIVAENPISGASKACLIQLFLEKSVPLVLVEKDRLYINFINHQVELAQKAVSTPLPEIGTYTGNEIYMAVAYLSKEQEQVLLSQLPGCQVTRWNDFGVDIVAGSGGKVSGIKAYLDKIHIRKEETMAFGDGENDIDMLKFVQLGVAMGNADELVKENAEYTTSSVDENGIMHALTVLHILDNFGI